MKLHHITPETTFTRETPKNVELKKKDALNNQMSEMKITSTEETKKPEKIEKIDRQPWYSMVSIPNESDKIKTSNSNLGSKPLHSIKIKDCEDNSEGLAFDSDKIVKKFKIQNDGNVAWPPQSFLEHFQGPEGENIQLPCLNVDEETWVAFELKRPEYSGRFTSVWSFGYLNPQRYNRHVIVAKSIKFSFAYEKKALN